MRAGQTFWWQVLDCFSITAFNDLIISGICDGVNFVRSFGVKLFIHTFVWIKCQINE